MLPARNALSESGNEEGSLLISQDHFWRSRKLQALISEMGKQVGHVDVEATSGAHRVIEAIGLS